MLNEMPEIQHTTRPGPLTLQQAIDRYQVFNESERKSPRTIQYYDHQLGILSKAFGAEFLISEFDEFALREHMVGYKTNSRNGAPLKPWTINGHARALRAFFRWAYLNEVTGGHLLGRYSPPKVPEQFVDILTDGEISDLLKAAERNKRDLAIMLLLLDTGVRAAELCSINVGDVDLVDGTVKVMGKGRKERIVPFGRKTRRAIIAYAKDIRSDAAHDEAAFLSSLGNRLSTNALSQLMRRLRKSSRIPRLHPHLMRHTFASKFLLNGGDALMLKHLLGHTTLLMTDRYVHFANAQGVKASQEFSPVDRHADGVAIEAKTAIQAAKAQTWPKAGWRS